MSAKYRVCNGWLRWYPGKFDADGDTGEIELLCDADADIRDQTEYAEEWLEENRGADASKMVWTYQPDGTAECVA